MAKYFTVGPSQLYPTVNGHIHEALDNHIIEILPKSPELQKLHQEIEQNLKKLLRIPQNFLILFFNSPLECMEQIIENLAAQNSLHFVCGASSKDFFNISYDSGIDARMYQVWVEQKEWFETKNLASMFNFEPELVCLTQNEISTGVQLDLPTIQEVKSAFPNAIVAMDCVSSVPAIGIDFNCVDAAFFSTQKLFGLPENLGILVLSNRAIEKANIVKQIKANNDQQGLGNIINQNKKLNQAPQNPNILAIYLLNQVVVDMLILGVSRINQDLVKKAQFLYSHFQKHDKYELYIKNTRIRSLTIIAIKTKIDARIIAKKLLEQGFVVSTGFGEDQAKLILIANFPATTLTEMQALVATLDRV